MAQGPDITGLATRVLSVPLVESVALSADGRQVAFTVLQLDPDSNRATEFLRVGDVTSGRVRTLARNAATNMRVPERLGPQWSPSGDRIAFAAPAEDGTVQLSAADPNSAQVRQITSFQRSIIAFHWCSTGAIAVIVQGASLPESQPAVEDQLRSSPPGVWLLDSGAGKPRAVAIGSVVPDWVSCSPDGTRLALSGDGDIAVVSLDRDSVRKLVSRPGDDRNPVWSPDGRTIAFITQGGAPVQVLRPAIVPSAGGDVRDLGKGADLWMLFDGPHSLAWFRSGRQILLPIRTQMRSHLYELDIDRDRLTRMLGGDRVIYPVSLAPGNSSIAYVASTPTSPGEVFVLSTKDTVPVQVSHEGSRAAAGVASVSRIDWRSADGLEVSGLLMRPPGYDSTRRYPLVVLMEGSHGVFDLSYSSRVSSDGFSWFGFQPRVLAALGYVVLMPNPRGSWGLGEAFERKEVGDFGDGPYHDIVSGVDALIARGIADSARLGIMGSGFDGYRAALALTRTSRFRVAIVEQPIFDLIGFVASEGGSGFYKRMFGSWPWESLAAYQDISPLLHAAAIRTPTLILDLDGLPFAIGQARQMYQVLSLLEVPTSLVRYPWNGSVAWGVGPLLLRDMVVRETEWLLRWLPPVP